MIDYHIHTGHSVDAQGSIVEYCSQALKRGLTEICFTNHCELDPHRVDNLIRFNGNILPFTRERLVQLRDEVLDARDRFKDTGITVKFGIEVGYYDGVEQRFEEMTEGITFDFVLGSVHCLDHMCIDSSKEYEEYFSQHNAEHLIEAYYETTERLVNSGLFDAVAHLDVYKKYGLRYYGNKISATPEPALARIFDLMKEKQVALELNTAGLRRIDEFYPSPDIMECARAQGITRITIGSDAHTVDDLGKGIAQGYEYLKSFGFTKVYGFDKRTPIPVEI